jgi:hypothetical protein
MGGLEDGRMGRMRGWEEGRRGGCLQAERCAHRAEHILHLADLRLPEAWWPSGEASGEARRGCRTALRACSKETAPTRTTYQPLR